MVNSALQQGFSELLVINVQLDDSAANLGTARFQRPSL